MTTGRRGLLANRPRPAKKMAYVVKLQGHVAYFDSDCIILRRDRHPQRVERPAISTVVSGKARRGSKIMAKLETALGVDL